MMEYDASEKAVDLLSSILEALEDIVFEIHQINIRATKYDRDL